MLIINSVLLSNQLDVVYKDIDIDIVNLSLLIYNLLHNLITRQRVLKFYLLIVTLMIVSCDSMLILLQYVYHM